MSNKFDYTTIARSFSLRFPLFTHISIQINYWVIAYVLLITVIYFNGMSLNSAFDLSIPHLYMPTFWAAVIIGIVYGFLLGLLDWKIETAANKNMSLGLQILIRSCLYFSILVGMIVFVRYILWEKFMLVYFYDEQVFSLNEESWSYFSYMFGVYSLVLTPGIIFINQMNKKFGPGVLLPMLFGKYRQPQEEERLFMFIDLKSSTTHAETLGHLAYSALIRDCFQEINLVLTRFNGEIYQYVGDEVVISWLKISNFRPELCLDFFFASQSRFQQKQQYYQSTYGLVPEFKAGVHIGIVTAVEVGDIKREIAYHGDTINTAARIRSVCNQYEKNLLISGELADLLGHQAEYTIALIGEMALKGKEVPTRILSVEK